MNNRAIVLGPTHKRNSLPIWILGFLFSPIAAAIFAFLRRNEYEAKVITCLFVGLFGFIMSTDDQGMDLYRYLLSLRNFSGVNNNIATVFENLYSSGSSSTSDLYVPLLTAIVGFFTDNSHFLMLVFGLGFGLFYAKTIALLPRPKTETWISFGLLFLFINVFGIQGLAGVRFYTAFYVFIFGAISYINTAKRIYLLALTGACLIHFSYIFAILLFIVFHFLKNRPRIIFMMAVVSFSLSFTSFSNLISQYSSIFGSSIEAKAQTYSTENDLYVDSIQERSEAYVWYVGERNKVAYGVIVASLALLYVMRKKIRINALTLQYLLLAMVFLTFRNIVIDVPDLGIRFSNIFMAIFYFFLYHFFLQNRSMQFARLLTCLNIAGGILVILYSIRCIFYYVSLTDIIMPGYIATIWTNL